MNGAVSTLEIIFHLKRVEAPEPVCEGLESHWAHEFVPSFGFLSAAIPKQS